MNEPITPYRTRAHGQMSGQKDSGAKVCSDAVPGFGQNLAESKGGGEYLLVPTCEISVAGMLSRQVFSAKALERLAESIKKDGMLQPIVVGRDTRGVYYLKAGIRRFLAAKSLGLEKVPCTVNSGEPILISLIENIMREDLSPIELAESFLHAMRLMGLNQKEFAEELGRSTTYVNDILRLNSLPESIKEKCRNSDTYSRSALLNIARKKTEKRMLAVFKKIENKDSEKTGEGPSGQPGDKKTKTRAQKDIFIEKLNSAVSAARKLEKGSINQEDINTILARLQKMEELMKQLGPRKSRVRDLWRWLKPSRWL